MESDPSQSPLTRKTFSSKAFTSSSSNGHHLLLSLNKKLLISSRLFPHQKLPKSLYLFAQAGKKHSPQPSKTTTFYSTYAFPPRSKNSHPLSKKASPYSATNSQSLSRTTALMNVYLLSYALLLNFFSTAKLTPLKIQSTVSILVKNHPLTKSNICILATSIIFAFYLTLTGKNQPNILHFFTEPAQHTKTIAPRSSSLLKHMTAKSKTPALDTSPNNVAKATQGIQSRGCFASTTFSCH